MTTISVSTTTDLVRFLLARVDEDDAHARKMHRQHRRGVPAATQDPGALRAWQRRLDECEAMRAVIGHAQQLYALRDLPAERVVRDTSVRMLSALALPYRAHHDFRPEWNDLASTRSRRARSTAAR